MKTYWIGNDDPHVVGVSKTATTTTTAAMAKTSSKTNRPSKVYSPLVSRPVIEAISELSENEDFFATPDHHHQSKELDDPPAANGGDPDLVHPANKKDNDDIISKHLMAPSSPDELGVSHRTQATVICDSLSEFGEHDDFSANDGSILSTPRPVVIRPKLRMKKKMIHMDGELRHIMDCRSNVMMHNLVPVNMDSQSSSSGTSTSSSSKNDDHDTEIGLGFVVPPMDTN
jgi:hypothetical protein